MLRLIILVDFKNRRVNIIFTVMTGYDGDCPQNDFKLKHQLCSFSYSRHPIASSIGVGIDFNHYNFVHNDLIDICLALLALTNVERHTDISRLLVLLALFV